MACTIQELSGHESYLYLIYLQHYNQHNRPIFSVRHPNFQTHNQTNPEYQDQEMMTAKGGLHKMRDRYHLSHQMMLQLQCHYHCSYHTRLHSLRYHHQ
ncbi:hypothetical protein Hanom_Chr16g01454851 [Helianthus anomalus]